MREILLTFCLLCGMARALHAQTPALSATERIYISTGTGINYENGMLGLQVGLLIPSRFMPFVALGFGSWGTKITPGLRYYFSHTMKSAIALSTSMVMGIPSVKENIELNTGEKATVEVEYKAVNTINVSYLHNWFVGKRGNFFNIEMGYSFSLNSNYKNNYIVKTSNVTLSSLSEGVLKLIQPGGLIIGVGFNFGL